MKQKMAVFFFAVTFFSTPSHAGSIKNPSDASVVASVLGSALIIASPFILIREVAKSSDSEGNVNVKVETEKGEMKTISLPAETVEKTNLSKGDRLTTKPTGTGALLMKNDQPVVYMVDKKNASLSRNDELVP